MTRSFGDGRCLVSKSEGGTALKSQIFSSRSDNHFMFLHPWLLTGNVELARHDSSSVIVVL